MLFICRLSPLQLVMYVCIAIMDWFCINKMWQLAIMNYIPKCGWEYPVRVQLLNNLPNPHLQARLLWEFQTTRFSRCWTSPPEYHTKQDPQFSPSFSYQSLDPFLTFLMTGTPGNGNGPKLQRIPIWLPSKPTLGKS